PTPPPVSPSGRMAFAAAVAGGETIMWGGLDATGVRADIWILGDTIWSQQFPSPGHIQPSARWHHAMAYDTLHSKMILFGGLAAAGQPLADTWALDSLNDWAQLGPTHVPPPRRSHAMAWDTVRQRVVMFGGDGGVALLADTWIWDGTDWTAH